MSKKECPSCAMMIDDREDVCPICQYEFAQTKTNKWFIIIVAIILLILTVIVFVIK